MPPKSPGPTGTEPNLTTSMPREPLFARVFVAAGGAVLVTAVLHGSFNAFGDKLTSTSHLTGSPLVVTPAGAVGIGVILITAVIVYALSKTGRLQRRRVTPRVAASGHGMA